jgi:hypothetical protein
MKSNSNNLNSDRSESPRIRVLLADSDSFRVKKFLAYFEQQHNLSICVCQHYFDLLPLLDRENPDLFLLGTFAESSCFDIAKECHKFHKDLKVFLLSNQNCIDDYFCRLASSKGITKIITDDLLNLESVLQNIRQQLIISAEANCITNFNAQNILTAIQEISQVGNNHFGALVQGNYWRKAHALSLKEFPTLINWSVEHFGIISCNKALLQSQVTDEDIQGLQRWIALYITECERAVNDFKVILKNSHLSLFAQQLLPELY